jgi:hypothetical protein
VAANSSSLRFDVVVTADQADKTLKALTQSFNQVGVQAKIGLSQIGQASKEAGAEVISLGDRMKGFAREQRSEARAVSFFVGELSQIAPIAGEAKMALSGIGQAMVGGLGIASGIGAAVAIVGALATAFRNAAEEAKKIADEIRGVQDALTVLMAGGGEAGARTARDVAIKAKEDEIARMEADLASRRQSTVRFLPEEENLVEKIRKARFDLQKIVIEGNERITAAERAATNERLANATREESEKKKIKDAGYKARLKDAMERAAAGAAYAESETANLLNRGTGDVGYEARLEEARYQAAAGAAYGMSEDANLLNQGSERSLAENQKEYNKELRDSISLGQQWGGVVGGAFSRIVTGQGSATEALAAIGQMMIQQITSLAITSITASAAKAGAESAASQAGIPVIGPALAIAAMGTMFASVMGMASRVPSAAEGWDLPAGGPFLTRLHSREMVLPEKYADVIREGGMGGGITLNVGGVIDSGSLERTITANNGAFARAQRKMRRRRRG